MEDYESHKVKRREKMEDNSVSIQTWWNYIGMQKKTSYILYTEDLCIKPNTTQTHFLLLLASS